MPVNSTLTKPELYPKDLIQIQTCVYTSLLTVRAGYGCVYMSSYLNRNFEKSFMHTLNMNKHVLADESTVANKIG